MPRVTKRTGKRRLLKLAAMLEADAKKKKGIKFDLHTVGKPSSGRSLNDIISSAPFVPTLDCGTTACAMGLASISGEFKRAGLTAKVNSLGIVDTVVNGRVKNFDEAAAYIFVISMKEAGYLFNPYAYPHDLRTEAKAEREVANRIRRLVAGEVTAAEIKEVCSWY